MVLKLSLSTMGWLGQKQGSQVTMDWNFWNCEPEELSSLSSSLPWIFCQSFRKLTSTRVKWHRWIGCQEALSQAEVTPQLRLCSWRPGSLVGPQKRGHCQHYERTLSSSCLGIWKAASVWYLLKDGSSFTAPNSTTIRRNMCHSSFPGHRAERVMLERTHSSQEPPSGGLHEMPRPVGHSILIIILTWCFFFVSRMC